MPLQLILEENGKVHWCSNLLFFSFFFFLFLIYDRKSRLTGPWRWFDESMLDCCEPLAQIKLEGITFGKVACLARCNGAKVEAFRSDKSSVDEFRKRVISCSHSEDSHVIVSYHRTHLNQVV